VRIGVDFDNTLVSYDDLLYRLARERELIPDGAPSSKREIRDAVRALPGGEIQWQRLQGLAYGPRIDQAEAIPGVTSFFRACAARGVAVSVVSHKTLYAAYDPTGTDLRQAALAWMDKHLFFASEGLGLARDDVHFATSRREKIECIRRLGCQVFIDDLDETFAEPGFPDGVERFLFSPSCAESAVPGVRSLASWEDLRRACFGAHA